MTHKRRLTIQDDYGEHIMAVYVEPDANEFDGADLTGLQAEYITNLRGKSFRAATLYWSNLRGADFSDCNFEGANFAGASMEGGVFRRANFRKARMGLDNLGGPTRFQGADLTGADLADADLKGAEYDSDTRFPPGFVPTLAGMIEKPGN